MSVGVDIGTGFLVSARQGDNNSIKIKSIRDAFLDLGNNDPQIKNMLKISKTDYIETADKLYIIGDPAIILANIFNREVRRPMSRGVLSPGEFEAEKVVLVLVESILGKCQTQPPEVCFYSVPAPAIDMDMDVIYHSAMFSKIIGESLGYKAVSLNEGAAVAYANAAPENFSALAISWGSGMINICLMYQTMIGMSFSIARSGDWIDMSAAKSTGSTSARIQSIKEKGIDLLDPTKGDPKTHRQREAITVYYKSLVLYALESIKNEFLKRRGTINLPTAVPIILSGGTALAGNFLEFFKTAYEGVKSSFPFDVSEIRMAKSPLNDTANGLLVAALNYDEANR
jgi:hypothetical protein